MELCQIRPKARMGVRTEERLKDLVGACWAQQRGWETWVCSLAASSGEEEERHNVS